VNGKQAPQFHPHLTSPVKGEELRCTRECGLNLTPMGRCPPYDWIEGRLFDNYAPSMILRKLRRARNIWDSIRREKIVAEQAGRIILNLDDSDVTLANLKQQFNDWPMPGLKEVIVVRSGRVIPFWP